MQKIKLLVLIATFMLLITVLYAGEKTAAFTPDITTNVNAGTQSIINTNRTTPLGLGISTFKNAINPRMPLLRNGVGVHIPLLAAGIVLIIFGAAGLGVGIPMWYYSAIGVGYITDHPGVVSVKPIDGNPTWLWVGYYAGISLTTLGGLLFVAGLICTVLSVVTPGGRARAYYKSDENGTTTMGLAVKL